MDLLVRGLGPDRFLRRRTAHSPRLVGSRRPGQNIGGRPENVTFAAPFGWLPSAPCPNTRATY